jgi:hypothetical protein
MTVVAIFLSIQGSGEDTELLSLVTVQW